MKKTRLGKTKLMVSRSGFGALPVQRLSKEDGAALLRRAFESGINFYDTANGYTDSEEKIGLALSDVRDKVIIATKTGAGTPDMFWKHLELSLKRMRTNYIDIYQFHNPRELPGDEMVSCMLSAKDQGMIRHIGITSHRLDNAIAEACTEVYETIQYPLSALSSERDINLVDICKQLDIGVIAMKALAGGLLNSAAPSMAFLRPHEHVVPIWGFQRDSELNEVIELEKNPPELDDAMLEQIMKDRVQLSGDFCRGCGYCMPCPAGIQITECARMPLLLRRAVWQNFTTPAWRERMEKISGCMKCGKCRAACPYSLDTPRLLKEALDDFRTFVKEHNLYEAI
ncbi:MAG: aldo/keto reductase [Oscillospiraceae bacterium]|jgi:aryl-alcohol dehydrogenase-like predicted oxidoreductase|nr:aldo/keto reductase [Oscillospiraceae bacterium]